MNRRPLRPLLLLAAVACLAGTGNPLRAQDKVEYRDRKTDKAVPVSGQITSESVAGVQIKPTGAAAARDIPASEILRVTYGDLPGAVKLDYPQAVNLDEKREYAKAIEGYQGMLPKLSGAPKTKRYVEYRIAMLKAGQAEGGGDAKEAVDALNAFLTAYPESWQYSLAAKQLARLQIDKGDFDAAAKTLDSLAKAPGLPKDMRQEADLLLIDALFRARKFQEVESKIQTAMNALPANDPQRDRFSVYQIAAGAENAKLEDVVKKLDAIIAKTEDNGLKALAYNTLGDCYLLKDRKRDAMWSYLWVDVVYFQDRPEHIKALERLAKLFEDLKDPRAAVYKEKLQRSR